MRWNGRDLVLECPGTVKDYISVDNRDYFLDCLNGGGRGGNSCVFRLVDPNEEIEPRAIKFSRFSEPTKNSLHKKRIARFEREIDALQQAAESDVSKFIVSMFTHDVWVRSSSSS